MELFRYLMRASRRNFFLAIGASAVSGMAGAAFIAIVNLAVGKGGAAPAALVWAFVLTCVCAVATRFWSQFLLFRLSQGAIYQLRRGLTESILGAPLRSIEKTGIPRLFSSLTDDVIVIADALPGLPLIVSSVAFVGGCLVYLAILSPVVSLAALAASVVGGTVFRLFSVRGMQSLRMAREEQDRLFDHFRAVTEGVKELKLHRQRREAFASEHLDATAASYRDHSVVGLSIFEGAVGGGQVIFFALIGFLLFLLPRLVEMPAGVLASLVLTILFAVANLQSILVWFPVLGRASVALQKIEERRKLLENTAERGGPVSPSPRFEGWKRLELDGVTHAYMGPVGQEFVLGPIDLEFRRGEVVFLVGGNGSGKTTLAKVLTGLYAPEKGAIRVDGTEIEGGNRDQYRQLFSAVFSDFFLFDTLLGLPAGDRTARAERYLARLELDHKVSIAGDKLSTTALSQGQRKRLALLTAYLEDRHFYVFDEWAADQDPVFKDVFYTRLVPELKAQNKTVLVISHDDRYFHVADRLVRLDYGQLRQEGVSSDQSMVAASAG
jgi:putative ATP-binding cassette transporter